jgi:glycyl-tRNA synthetase beta chain
MPDFLLEIGCEEIPARMLKAGSDRLGNNIAAAMQHADFPVDLAHGKIFSTPRRISVYLPDLPAREPDIERNEVGPSWKIAFMNGAPTPAAEAFAKKHGAAVSSLEKVTTPKGEYIGIRVIRKGRATSDVLKQIVEDQLKSLHWEKTMYWRAKTSERFVRPIRWLVALLGEQVIPIEFAGIPTSRASYGHRILSTGKIEIRSPKDYVQDLKANAVLVDAEERRRRIIEQVQAMERERAIVARRDDLLLDELTNLTEFPSVILGSFDREFLQLPEEVLVTVMRDHQKYFAVEDATGKLLPHFLAVLNTNGDPQGTIRHGHERVLRARFNDARFFWQTDQKHPLRERTEWLKHVTFQKDLGSYHEKALRVQRLASWLSEIIRQSGLQIRPGVIHKAAYLAKTDLTTELVKEFTELQGIVGGLYAGVQPLDSDMPENTRFAIADAIYDHYKPESMEDSVPRTIEGAVLSIADKADNIAGMFALGLVPSGSKDPFALRRQANGIVKIIAEYKLPVQLSQLFFDAREAYRGSEAEKKFSAKLDFAGAVRDFFRERLEFYLRDVLGFKYDVVNAVLAAGSDDVVDALARAKAVTKVRGLPDFESVAAAFKRINNILRQAREKGFSADGAFQYFQDTEHEEKLLMAKAEKLKSGFEKAVQEKDYADALIQLSTLRPDIDTFFDKVMVMVEDERIRANRLALLQTLLKEFSTIADFSEIVTEGKSL